MSSELIYGDFIPEELKLSIARIMQDRFEGLNYVPVLYASLEQAVLDEANAMMSLAIKRGMPDVCSDENIITRIRILASNARSAVQNYEQWEPEHAYRVLAKRLLSKIEALVD